jgi:CRP/FNR family transcriptional regulator, nitrogen oxide reductase regulator
VIPIGEVRFTVEAAMSTITSPARERRTPLRVETADSRACTLESRRLNLRQFPSFRALPGSDLRHLSEVFWERPLRPGDVVYRQGEPATRLYLLTTGRVRLDRAGAGEATALLDIFGPSDLFGEAAVREGAAYDGTASAISAGCTLVVSAPDFRGVCERYPSVALAALQVLAERLAAARTAIERRDTHSLDQRVAAALDRLATKFGDASGGDLLIQVPLTREDLGAMTGATLESVSRVMSQFRRDGLIRGGRGWVAVRDRERLAAVAQRTGS